MSLSGLQEVKEITLGKQPLVQSKEANDHFALVTADIGQTKRFLQSSTANMLVPGFQPLKLMTLPLLNYTIFTTKFFSPLNLFD